MPKDYSKEEDPFSDIGQRSVAKPGYDLNDPFADIGGYKLSKVPKKFTPEEEAESKKQLETYIKAPFIGALEGATGGYGSRALPEDAIRIAKESPISRGVGYGVGALIPGSAIAKALNLARIPQLAGVTAGAVEGFLSDPGEGSGTDVGERAVRGGVGAAGGGTLGVIGKVLGGLKTKSDIYDKLGKSGYAKEVKGEIDSALKKLIDTQVTPKKSELLSVIGDKKVSINPEYLKGFKREATLGPKREKGGLDRFASLIQGKAYGPQAEITGKQAQRLKEYFDSISNYSRQKPFSESASATGDRSKAVADLLRGKISSLDTRVSDLNEPMSEALKLRQNIRAASESDPLSTVTADPMTGKGQQILDLDAAAKTKLSELGKNISAAKKMRVAPENLVGIEGLKSLFRGGKRLTGKYVGGGVSKLPEGSKESVILKLLDSMKNQSSSEEEE